MPLKDYFPKLSKKESLDSAEMAGAMESIVTGSAEDRDIEEFLILLREKGETAHEIAAAARVMRKHALKLSKNYPDLLDTCGTGADEHFTINVSTLAAIVAASAGVQVGKHGNRSVSSVCGSADLLELLGMKMDQPIPMIEASIERVGFGFFFAPHFHPATRFAMPARKRIKGKTLFNLLGPLSNPGGALHQLVGVYDKRWVTVFAEVLSELGARKALVVYGMEGLDEISISARTFVADLDRGHIRTYFLSPHDFGIAPSDLGALKCLTKEASRESAQAVLEGSKGPKTDIVCLNAGAALYVAGKVKTIREGVLLARELMESGEVQEKLEEIMSFSHRYEY
ncbi:MAG: anthranilate phosphoribosyltransferase [Candidatus Omnitrophica bacterium]|nr:anthranilate phosphoribosyltransferase [Candidatus Omnitrophota bacterium]